MKINMAKSRYSAPLKRIIVCEDIERGLMTEAEQNRLIIEHMDLVEPIAAQFRGAKSIPFDDLVAAGRESLVLAARSKFDATKSKFNTYASTCIRNGIIDYIREWKHLIPVSDEHEVHREFYEWDVSVSNNIYLDWETLAATPEELCIAFEELNKRHLTVTGAIRFLPVRERQIIHARYFRDPPQTLNGIAREHKMPYQTLVDLIARILRKLAKQVAIEISPIKGTRKGESDPRYRSGGLEISAGGYWVSSRRPGAT